MPRFHPPERFRLSVDSRHDVEELIRAAGAEAVAIALRALPAQPDVGIADPPLVAVVPAEAGVVEDDVADIRRARAWIGLARRGLGLSLVLLAAPVTGVAR